MANGNGHTPDVKLARKANLLMGARESVTREDQANVNLAKKMMGARPSLRKSQQLIKGEAQRNMGARKR